MKAQWQALAGRFAARRKSERQIIALAVILGIGMGGYTLWVEPAARKVAVLKQQIARSAGERQNLRGQIGGLKAQVKDPDAPNKAALAQTQARLAGVVQELRAFENVLVPPERIPQFLQALLARHRGLELVSLKTLPPVPLLASKAGDAKAESKPATVLGLNIHKHGIEFKMAGGYLDLLSYVAELERLPQKLMWGKLVLAVVAHPKCELTLTVYTLSLNSVWLVV